MFFIFLLVFLFLLLFLIFRAYFYFQVICVVVVFAVVAIGVDLVVTDKWNRHTSVKRSKPRCVGCG